MLSFQLEMWTRQTQSFKGFQYLLALKAARGSWEVDLASGLNFGPLLRHQSYSTGFVDVELVSLAAPLDPVHILPEAFNSSQRHLQVIPTLQLTRINRWDSSGYFQLLLFPGFNAKLFLRGSADAKSRTRISLT